MIPTSRLALLRFRDVVVTPYTDLIDGAFGGENHRGGPRWPDWENQTIARHCVRGRTPSDVEPPDLEPVHTLGRPAAWGGAITGLFGHDYGEFSQRLLPTLVEAPDLALAFASRDGSLSRPHDRTPAVRSWEDVPESFRFVLDWFGIPQEQVELIAEPTLVERLAVAPQAEQLRGPWTPPWYLDMLDAHTSTSLGEVGKDGFLYVSRAGQRARFAGEVYLEEVFRKVGFRVLRPEDVSLEEELRAYAGADAVIFAEGTALHAAQLIGRSLGNVTVLARRRGVTLARSALEPRARSLRYVDGVRTQVHAFLLSGQTWPFAALTLLDPEKLLRELPIGGPWDSDAFEAAVEADVEEWLKASQESPPSWAVFSSDVAVESLRAAGLGHLERVLS